MAQYQLLGTHIITDSAGRCIVVPSGTLVGDSTPYAITTPSPNMVGVDDAGKAAVTAIHDKLFNDPAKSPPAQVVKQCPGFYPTQILKKR
jgi:hypothetical protein